MPVKILSSMKNFRNRFLAGPVWRKSPPVLILPFGKVIRSYIVSSWCWCNAALDHVLTAPTRLLLLLYVLIGLHVLIFRPPYLAIVPGIITVVWLVDLAAKFFFAPRIEAKRILPQRVRQGVPFHVHYEVKNTDRRNGYSFHADPWLPDKKLLLQQEVFFNLPAGRQTIVNVSYTAQQRGLYPCPQPVMETAFPLSVFKYSRRFGKPETLIVHPYYTRLNEEDFMTPDQLSGEKELFSSPRPGNTLDFYACRDYRYGDSPKKIHWKATARHGKLTVKDFQQEQLSSAAVFLDTGLGTLPGYRARMIHSLRKSILGKTDGDKVFEAALSLCASIVHTLRIKGYQLEVFLPADNELKCLYGESGMENGENGILDTLAELKPMNKDPFENQDRTFPDKAEHCDLVFLILRHWNIHTQNFCRQLREGNAGRLNILFVDSGKKPAGLPPEIRFISPRQIYGKERNA